MFEADRGDRAVLALAQQLAGAADLEIVRRDLEAGAELGEPLQHREPLLRLGRDARLLGDDQVAERALARAADAAAQLVELRQPEAIGVVDDHRVGARDVEAGLDDRRADEDVVAAVDEVDHHLLELALRHLAVADRDARPLRRELARCASPARRCPRSWLWTKNSWPPRASSRLIASPSSALVEAADERADRQPVGGRRRDDRDLAQPAHRHLQRARDRRRGQRQHVDLRAQLLEPLLVGDAEALLLVDDQQAEILEADVARQQAVRADDDVDLAVRQRRHRLLLLGLAAEARQHARRAPGSR